MYKIYSDYFVQPRGRTNKLLMVMKLTTLLLLLAIMQVSAMTYAQKVSLTVKNSPLSDVLDKISDQTGYNFFYSNSALNDTRPVSLDVKNVELNNVLQQIFAGQPLEFTITDKMVVIKEKEIPLKYKPKAERPVLVISGKVVNEKGEALPGVTIKVKGTNLGWITNAGGLFYLAVNTPDAILQFSFVGYTTQEIPAGNLKNPVTIVLKEDIGNLNDVQVIGYSTTTKRANTGDVTTVSAKTIAQYPTTNVLDVLQGTVPGLTVYKNTGNANGSYKVQIRGTNGTSSAQPLYVIDGIPYRGGGVFELNTSLGSSAAQQGSGGYDAMDAINPDDIESISILKDADATSIYGSRGADGVVLITTKKGKSGAASINASVYSGINSVAHFQPMLNLQQYLQMRHEAKANDGSAISTTDYDINGVWDTTRSTNWQKALIGGFGHNTNAQLGISGGSEDVQYRINGGYNYTSDLEHLGGNDQKASLKVNITSTTKNKKLSVLFSGGYLYDINTESPNDLIYAATTLAPDAPALYTSTGALNYQNNTFANPLVTKNEINHTPSYNLTSGLVLSYKPIKDLEIQLTTGYNKRDVDEFLGNPTSASPPYQPTKAGSTFAYITSNSWSIEPQVNYTKKMGKGTLLATVGASLQGENYTHMALQVSGYSSDLLLSSPTAGTSITTASPLSVSPDKFASLFGRINYNWADKYYIDLTGRDDGSSKFGQNRQYHVFAAVGAGWIFSEEDLIKNNLQFLSFGKLRGSYGTTGRSSSIVPYEYLSTYSSNGVAYSSVSGLTPTRLPNPDLAWETTTKAELGLELQFLKGRIAFTTNFYRNRTTGLLTDSGLPYVTGFSSITKNLPATIQNAGFDATLTTTNFKSKDFAWSTTFLFTGDRNKLLSYPGLATSTYVNSYIIGQSVNIQKVYRFGGVNPQTGIYQFYGANGQITASPDPATDRTAVVNIDPDFYGSIQNNITYKQFSLSFLFRGIKQKGRNAFGNISFPPGLASNYNVNTLVLNRWQKPGDVTNIQRYGTSFALYFPQLNAENSNAAFSDASYIRLQNVALTYTLPKSAANKMHMQNLQVFVQGENLLTITGYNGMDPETQNIGSLPPLRIMTIGLRLTL